MSAVGDLRIIPIPDAARPVLAWAGRVHDEVRARSSVPTIAPIAFRGASAVALAAGDLARFAAQPEVLLRTHSLAQEYGLAPDAPPCTVDAADFDVAHRESSRPWSEPGAARQGPEAVGNRLRTLALRRAVRIAVADTDFTTGGPTYAVDALSPGWAAIIAMAGVAEAEDACARGFTGPWRIEARAAAALDTLCAALEVERGRTGATLERLRSLVPASQSDAPGRSGVDATLERFFRFVETHPGLYATLDAARSAAGAPPWGIDRMLDAVDYAATSVDFDSVLGISFDGR